MGTKLSPGKYDCISKAKDDEPIFVLLGHDKHAPALVWLWAVLRELDSESPEVVADARQCVQDMVDYAVANGKKSVGVGQAVLAGVLELIRAVNRNVSGPKNELTDVDTLRQFLASIKE